MISLTLLNLPGGCSELAPTGTPTRAPKPAPTRTRSPTRALRLALPLVLAIVCLPAAAQQSAEEAIALVDVYIKAHNAHQPEEVLAMYHPDADFHLSMGRGVVSGRDDIARLEYFDAAAGSTLYPQALTARPEGDRWVVGFGYVIEYSDIFAAMGLNIVLAEGMERGFVFENGRIRTIYQPDLLPACMEVMAPGFVALVAWLQETGDPRADTLLSDGALELTEVTAPLLVEAAVDWRRDTGWGPSREQAFRCAQVPAQGRGAALP